MHCECPELKKILTKTNYFVGNAIKNILEATNATPAKARTLLEEAKGYIDAQLEATDGDKPATKRSTKKAATPTPAKKKGRGRPTGAKNKATATPDIDEDDDELDDSDFTELDDNEEEEEEDSVSV